MTKSKHYSYIKSVYIGLFNCNQNGNTFLIILFLAQEEAKYAEWASVLLVVNLFAEEHALAIHNLII